MKESVRLNMVCISSNNDGHRVPKTFTPLHYTCRHFTSSHLKTYLNQVPLEYKELMATFDLKFTSCCCCLCKIFDKLLLAFSQRIFQKGFNCADNEHKAVLNFRTQLLIPYCVTWNGNLLKLRADRSSLI